MLVDTEVVDTQRLIDIFASNFGIFVKMCATLCPGTSKTLVLLHIIAGKTFQRHFRGSWNV